MYKSEKDIFIRNLIVQDSGRRPVLIQYHREKALVWFQSEGCPRVRQPSDRNQTGSDMIQTLISHSRNDPPDKPDNAQTYFRHDLDLVQIDFYVWFGTNQTGTKQTNLV
jgi:hypothetical protein